jgi:hypothetical protein
MMFEKDWGIVGVRTTVGSVAGYDVDPRPQRLETAVDAAST